MEQQLTPRVYRETKDQQFRYTQPMRRTPAYVIPDVFKSSPPTLPFRPLAATGEAFFLFGITSSNVFFRSLFFVLRFLARAVGLPPVARLAPEIRHCQAGSAVRQ